MPSNTHRIVAAIATAGLFIGGAWVASGFRTDIAEASASSTGAQSDEGLIVNLHGARNDKGNLIVMAFGDETPFNEMDYSGAAGYVELAASTISQRVDFPELNDNYYAVLAIHDENGDYELNYDEYGIPTEGYAVSGMNSLYEDSVFFYSLIAPGMRTDLGFFYWQ